MTWWQIRKAIPTAKITLVLAENRFKSQKAFAPKANVRSVTQAVLAMDAPLQALVIGSVGFFPVT
jgi:hypothetical protein